MNEAVLQFRVGVFVLLSFIILSVLIFIHIEGFQSQYSVYIKPWSAPGVEKNTPIRKNGLLIGRVANVATQDDHVNIQLRINQGENVYENEMVRIKTESVFGDAVVEIVSADKDSRGELITDSGMLTNVKVDRNPIEVMMNIIPQVDNALTVITEAGDSVKKTSDSIRDFSQTINDAINDDESEFRKLIVDARKLTQRADSAFEQFNRVFSKLNDSINDPELQKQFSRFVENLPKFVEDVSSVVNDARETVNSFRKVSAGLDKNLDQLAPFTKSLGEDGPKIVAKIQASLTKVDQLVKDVQTFTQSIGKIGSGDSTISKLLNDRELYDIALNTFRQAQEAVENIREGTEKLEPILNDARTFTDSIARDPRQLGIRGATDFRPLGTGYKARSNGRTRRQ